MAELTKELIISTEFNAESFTSGINNMLGAIEKLTIEEDQLKKKLAEVTKELNITNDSYKKNETSILSLDKNSKTYASSLAKLTTENDALKKKQNEFTTTITNTNGSLEAINKSAVNYKSSLQNISLAVNQVLNDTKGKTLFDTGSLNKQVQEILASNANLRSIFTGKIDTSQLDNLEVSLEGTSDEFKKLGEVIQFLKANLESLDPNSEEFKTLNNVVKTGEQVLTEYGNAFPVVETKTVSLRSKLAALQSNLVVLEEQGKENTAEFIKMQIEAGKLSSSIGNAQRRIQVLSSDTKALDFGVAAVRAAVAGYGVAEGAIALFGIRNEAVTESIKRLNAILVILNGLTELSAAFKKQEVLAIVGQTIATKAATIANTIFAVAVGSSTGAIRALRIALLSTGLLGFIVLIGLAAKAFGLFSDDADEAAESQEKYNLKLKETNAQLDVDLKKRRQNQQLSEEILKEQGKAEDELSANRVAGLLAEKDILKNTLTDIRHSQDEFLSAGFFSDDYIEKSNADATTISNSILDIDFQITLEKQKTLTSQTQDFKKALEKQQSLYQDYQNKLSALQKELRDKTLGASIQDEAAIKKAFQNSLSDALADVNKSIQSGDLTTQRGNVLKSLLKQINKIDANEGIKQFKDESEKAEKDLSDTLYSLRITAGLQRADLIEDQFLREATIVRINSRNETTQLIKERDSVLKQINDSVGTIDPVFAKENVEKIVLVYDELLLLLKQKTTKSQAEITTKAFEESKNSLEKIFSSVQLILSTETTKEIQTIANQYLSGTITYQEYQKELTRITSLESNRRLNTELREQDAILKTIQARIKLESDPSEVEDLKQQEAALLKSIDELKRQEAIASAEENKIDNKAERDEDEVATDVKRDEDRFAKKIDEISKYAVKVGEVVNSIVSFWADANEAEQQELERSISIQEKRVEAAVVIADRGNAEYLQLEEDRLNELLVQQEEAANRQIAINAVLQTSQALVAFVSALAAGVAEGGPLGGIAIAAAVISAIAAGYAIIQSLKPDIQPLSEGSSFITRKGHPAGVDTIPAMLTEGEAVIPKKVNKLYKPSIDAIYSKKIPHEDMNAFVDYYKKTNHMPPELNYDKIDRTLNVSTYKDDRLNQTALNYNYKIDEQTEILKKVYSALKSMGVNVNVDKNGLAVSVMQAINHTALQKRV